VDCEGVIVQPEETEAIIAGGCAVHVERDAERTTARLVGDLELASAWDVEEVLRRELNARPASLEVSLAGLDFLDSAGLRVLLILSRTAQSLGVPLRFTGPRGPVRRTLDFAKALDYLGITD
jgi:anti-anti-sigma factor